ncbi:AAA family ATPase [Actinosynnema sp. NPDC059797]
MSELATGRPVAGPSVGNSASAAEASTVVQVGGSLTGDVVVHANFTSPTTPRQVPPPPAGFVNRNAELAQLSNVLLDGSDGHRGLVVVTGMAGVGKTAMVRRWVAAEGHRFPGGQLHVDFASVRTESGAPVSDALADCLLALGVSPEHVPSTLSGRTNMFRTKTALMSVLVVLDDVTEPAQVPPFIPNSAGSAVVVTSKDRLSELALDGAYSLNLGPLDRHGGFLLLREICGTSRLASDLQSVYRLVELSAGYPIALRVIAARLLAQPYCPIGDLVDELEDEEARLEALSLRGERLVSRVFDNAYRNLPAPSSLLYRRLGVIGFRTFTLDTAVVLLARPRAEARRALSGLLETSLVELSPEGRFVVHDLVRLHAVERSRLEDPPEDRRAVSARICEYYLTTAAFADDVVMGDRKRISTKLARLPTAENPFRGEGKRASGLEWLIQERANLLVVLDMMRREGWHSSAWQLAESLLALYLNRRYVDDWLEASAIGIESAREDGNPAAEARLRSVVSRAYTDLNEMDTAEQHLDVALELAEASGDKVLIASVWEFIGRLREKVDPDSSIEAYRYAIERNGEVGEKRGMALATYFMGCVLSSKGDHVGAREALTTAYRMFVSVDDERMALRGSMSLGVAYLREGNLQFARRELERVAQAFRQTQASYYEAQAREVLAEVEEREGELTSARENLERVIEIRRASGVPDVSRLVAHVDRLKAHP